MKILFSLIIKVRRDHATYLPLFTTTFPYLCNVQIKCLLNDSMIRFHIKWCFSFATYFSIKKYILWFHLYFACYRKENVMYPEFFDIRTGFFLNANKKRRNWRTSHVFWNKNKILWEKKEIADRSTRILN